MIMYYVNMNMYMYVSVYLYSTGQSAEDDAAQVSAAQTQDQQKTANAVHDATVAGARAKVSRATVSVDRRTSRVFSLAQPHGDTGSILHGVIIVVFIRRNR